MNAERPSASRKFPFGILLLAGFLVGTLDITAACTDYYIATGKGPEGVLKYVASGVFGKNAFSGGTEMSIWGLIFHFIIAYSFTFLFYLLYTRFRWVRSNPVLFAILYGIFMWAITTKAVIPLSNIPAETIRPFAFWKAAKAALILIVMISLPLTLIMRKYFKTHITQVGTRAATT